MVHPMELGDGASPPRKHKFGMLDKIGVPLEELCGSDNGACYKE